MRVGSIDVLKAICAFLVVCIHVPFPGPVGEFFVSLARIAVPVFFIITGYFYSDTVRKHGEIKQIKKILKLVIVANGIYLLWDLFYAVINSNMTSFFRLFTWKNILKFLVLNDSPIYGHLWYLGAILYVLVIVFIADNLHCRRLLYAFTPLLLIGDLVLGKYSIVIFAREFPYIFVRNFLFVGVPYFCIGLLIREKLRKNIERTILCMLIVLFCLTTFGERAILESIDMNGTRDHYISTTFLAIAVFLFAMKSNVQKGYLVTIGQKYSTWVYIIHPIFITCLGFVMERVGFLSVYKYVAPIIVYVVTIIFLMFINKVTRRY